MKTTRIDTAKADKRKAAIESLKARPIASENSIQALRERVSLLETIMGLDES